MQQLLPIYLPFRPIHFLVTHDLSLGDYWIISASGGGASQRSRVGRPRALYLSATFNFPTFAPMADRCILTSSEAQLSLLCRSPNLMNWWSRPPHIGDNTASHRSIFPFKMWKNSRRSIQTSSLPTINCRILIGLRDFSNK